MRRWGVIGFLCIVLASAAFADGVNPNLRVCPKFDQFPVKTKFSGPYKQPDINQSKDVRRFRTQLRYASEGTPTYAGYFNVAEWGCGTACDEFAAINRRTGKVFMFDMAAAYGVEYSLDSRLILVDSTSLIRKGFADDPQDMPTEGDSAPDTYTTYYLIYDEDTGIFSRPARCHQVIDGK